MSEVDLSPEGIAKLRELFALDCDCAPTDEICANCKARAVLGEVSHERL